VVLHVVFFAHNFASAVGYNDGNAMLFNILQSEAKTYCLNLMVY